MLRIVWTRYTAIPHPEHGIDARDPWQASSIPIDQSGGLQEFPDLPALASRLCRLPGRGRRHLGHWIGMLKATAGDDCSME
jgi:hypothetical protein